MSGDEPGPSNGPVKGENFRIKGIFDFLCDGPFTVLDQALADAERYPECSKIYAGRMLAAPSSLLRPCKMCCGVTSTDGSLTDNSRNYTPEEIENMTDTCPAHIEDERKEERLLAKAVLEARLAKKVKQEQTRLAKEAKQAEKMKNQKNLRNKKAKRKTKVPEIEVQPIKMEIDEDDIDDYIYETKKAKKKKKQWFCPECSKSAKYGSCGCVGCGEWYHFACAGFRNLKDIPSSWTCQYCLNY
uniref:PHD-type domain-containing protein n=1 Tax=Caenorhabditis tropicalis TaxID=1561998 RepID=A0A1I7U0H4_9PELO